MKYREEEVRIDAVAAVGRHRTDIGDLGDLVESIEARGLMNPITITPDGELIAGQRRLEAVRKLGHLTIRATVVTDLNSAAERLAMEHDENVMRKPMTPGELVSLGKALEKLETPKATERMSEAGRSAAPGRPRERGDHVIPPFSNKGKTRGIVAPALGMSGASYDRAKAVVNAANDPDAAPQDRERAQAARAEMTATGNIQGAYNKVRKPVPRESISKAADQRRTLDRAVIALSGITHGLKQIETLHPDLTDEEAAQWVDGLCKARTTISALVNRLKGAYQC